MVQKKALLVGINYHGTSSELKGCINDVFRVKAMLLTKGYLAENITCLVDTEDTTENLIPTRVNIMKYLFELIIDPCSIKYFHYSGHGSQVRDLDYDETDGKDECLVPLDYQTAGMIIDDELKLLVSFLKKDQFMTMVNDCCHSGSSIDLCYNLYERYGSGYLQLVKEYSRKKTNGQCIMISGCRDSQTSQEIKKFNIIQGALTNMYLKNLDNSNSYAELILNVRNDLKKEGYSQVPMISTGRYLDLYSKIYV